MVSVPKLKSALFNLYNHVREEGRAFLLVSGAGCSSAAEDAGRSDLRAWAGALFIRFMN